VAKKPVPTILKIGGVYRHEFFGLLHACAFRINNPEREEGEAKANMVFENVRVIHKAFGDGIITEQVGNYITVKFSSVTKKFVYPDAFERFLTLEAGVVADDMVAQINSDIAASKKAKQLIQDKKNEENLRAMKHGIVIPGKEAGNDSDEDEGRNKESEEL